MSEDLKGDPRFRALLDEMWALHAKKAADYGTDNDYLANLHSSGAFGVSAFVAAMLKLNDKVARIQSFVKNGALQNESVYDSLIDIACYALLGSILLTEERDGEGV